MGSGGQGQGGNWAQSQVAGLGGAPSWAGPAQSTASTIGTNTSPQAASNFATNAQSAQAQGQSSTPSPTGTTSANTPSATSNVNNPMPTDAWTPMTANTPFIQQQVNAGMAGLPPDLAAYIQAQNPGQRLADYWNNNSSLASNNPAQNSQIAQMQAAGQLPQNWYQGPAAPAAAPPAAPQSIYARGQSLSPAQMQSDMIAAHLPAWASGSPLDRSPYMIGQVPGVQQQVAQARAALAANGTPYASAGIPGQQLGVGDMAGVMGGSTQGAQTPSWLSGLLQQAGLA